MRVKYFKLLALVQALAVVGLLAFTNTELVTRISLLLTQGRYSTIAITLGLWIVALAAVVAILAEKRHSLRIFWAVFLAICGCVAWGFKKAAHLELGVYDVLAFWEARHEVNDAVATYTSAIRGAFLLLIPSVLIFSTPFISQTLDWNKWVVLRRLVPALPISLIAMVLYMKAGNGHFALPKQFSQAALVAVVTGKLTLRPVQQRSGVTWQAAPTTSPKRILFIVDESVRGDYVSPVQGDALTPNFAVFARSMANYGPTVSGSICSNNSNAIFRFVASRDDLGGRVSANPTIWQFAKAAGYRTVFIDAQAYWIKSVSRMQNYMNLDEAKYIDAFYPLLDTTPPKADFELLEIVKNEMAKGDKVFIFANKQGVHVPYDQNYNVAKGRQHPTESEANDHRAASMIKSYRNAIDWNIDHYFEEFNKAIDLRDTAVIYTADHGQQLDPNDATHCKSSGVSPQMALVPMYAFIDDVDKQTQLQRGAELSRGKASHFQIVPTVLSWMGYRDVDLKSKYSESLTKGTTLAPAFSVGDIFGLFSSDVLWEPIDLNKDYLEERANTAPVNMANARQ